MGNTRQVKYYKPKPGYNELIGGWHPEPDNLEKIYYSSIVINTMDVKPILD